MALTVTMETVTLIGIGRQNLTCLCIKCMQLIVFFSPADILFFWGGRFTLDLNKYIFPWQGVLFERLS